MRVPLGRHPARAGVAGLLGVALLALAACGGSGERTARPAPGPTAPPTVATTVVAPTAPPTTTTTVPEQFAVDVRTVSAAELGASWRAGCPVGPEQLRRIVLTYWDFGGVARTGALVVNADVVTPVVEIFRRLFAERFPIRRMDTIDVFGGSDDASMAADNTSAFNCRYAVAPGTPSWSTHAYGRAIDVNPVENPYLYGGRFLPEAGAAYANRADVRPGMAVLGGTLVEAFAANGWSWGGRWMADPDYQHFTATGS